MKKIYLFLLMTCSVFAQSIEPSDVVGLCSGQSVVASNPTSSLYNNLRLECSTTPLTNTLVLYYIQIESGTTFTFEVTPQANMDYDFASWKNPNFSNLGPSDRGSQNDPTGVGVYTIGLSMLEPDQTCEVAGASTPAQTGVIPGMVRYYDVEPGDGILIAINRWSQVDAGFEISFGGNAVLDCDLEPKIFEKCDVDYDGKEVFNLNQIKNEITTIQDVFTIHFFEDYSDAIDIDAVNFLGNNIEVTVENSPKIIYARFLRANGVYAKTIEVELNVNRMAKPLDEPMVYELCDYERDGKEIFNLRNFESDLRSLNGGGLDFKYFETEEDALVELEREDADSVQNALDATVGYESGTKVIYVVVAMAGKCKIILPIQLRVNTMHVVSKTIAYSKFCGNEQTDKSGNIYNLKDFLPELLAPVTNLDAYSIVFYNSGVDLDTGVSIQDPENYFLEYGKSVSIVVKIKNTASCTIYSYIELRSMERSIFEDQIIYNCSFYELPPLQEGYGYFTEPSGGGIQIVPGTSEAVIYGFKTIYVYGYESNVINGKESESACYDESKFEIKTVDCDVPKGISPNGDGLNDFWDLRAFEIYDLKIYNRYGALVYSHGLGYKMEWMGQSNAGGILPDGVYWYVFTSLGGLKNGWVVVNR